MDKIKILSLIFMVFFNTAYSQIVIENLNVNTKNSDFGLVLYGENKVIGIGV